MASELVYLDRNDSKIVRKKKSIIVERVLTDIVQKHGGISPALLVDEAMDESHELHDFFEWNDSEAARKYRLRQATEMILATKFVCLLVEKNNKNKVLKAIDDAAKPPMVRKFLPSMSDEGMFKGRPDVLSDIESRRAIIEKKISVLRSWCNSVIDINELNKVRTGILELIAK